MAKKRILQEMKELKNTDIDGITAGPVSDTNIFEWTATLAGPKDSPYEEGIFLLAINFPQTYPFKPPKISFQTKIYHPNVYADGKVCISILHPPGEDKWGYEKAEERWRPVHSASSIILSIISLLSAPNDESPANVDAAKIWREDEKQFQEIVNKCVRDSVNL